MAEQLHLNDRRLTLEERLRYPEQLLCALQEALAKIPEFQAELALRFFSPAESSGDTIVLDLGEEGDGALQRQTVVIHTQGYRAPHSISYVSGINLDMRPLPTPNAAGFDPSAILSAQSCVVRDGDGIAYSYAIEWTKKDAATGEVIDTQTNNTKAVDAIKQMVAMLQTYHPRQEHV